MFGRMIPASTVQAALIKIINTVTGEDGLTPTEIAAIEAGEDMGLLEITSRNPDGTPRGISWANL